MVADNVLEGKEYMLLVTRQQRSWRRKDRILDLTAGNDSIC